MLKEIASAYWPSFRKYWVTCVITLIAMIISVSLQSISPHYMRDIVNNFVSDQPDIALAKELFSQMVLIVVGIMLMNRVHDFSLAWHESHAMCDIDINNFRVIQQQSVRFFEDTPAGSLTSKARRFCASYENIVDLFIFQFGKNVVMFVVISTVFIRSLPQLAVPFIGWSVVFFTYGVLTTWWKYKYDKQAAETDSKVGAALADSLNNHMAVKACGQEVAEGQRFAMIARENHRARLKSWLYGDGLSIGQALITAGGELSLIWWMISNWENGGLTAGDFIFVQTFVVWAINQLWSFSMNLRRLFNCLAQAEEMAQLHHQSSEVCDAPSAGHLVVEDGEVEFRAVQFRYDSTVSDAINNFTLTIQPGQSVGLVGKSGAGKSTIVKLLLRFYDLDAGRIRIDRQDIAHVTQTSLRQQLAVVAQRPQLFHRSVRENIAFGSPHATEKEIISAAQLAYAWDFIQELPNGLDTIVGEQGVKLSGGQQQRIAIARAILADPRILILDEATSSLDSETEWLIQRAIANLLKSRTAIVIAHRLSTIMQLDRIVVMERGRIIESGTHSELLDQEGVYANLWAHQSGGYIN